MSKCWTKQFYTEEEDAIICEMYPTHSAKEIRAQFLPHRSIGSIQSRGITLGVKKIYEEPAVALLEEEPLIDDGSYKQCSKCRRFKRKKYFNKDRTRPDGLHPYCKACISTRGKNIKRGDNKKEKEIFEEGTKRCTICKKIKPLEQFYRNKTARDGRWPRCKVCDDARKERSYEIRTLERIKRYTNFTIKEYQSMLEEQKGVCAICGQPETTQVYGKTRALAIDHCRVTDAVRGLLCQKCNQALGLMGENPNRVKALLKYIEERCLW